MNKLFTFIFPLLIFLLGSCISQHDQSKTEFEQAVFYQIFPILLDSIYSDRRLIPPPPPFLMNGPDPFSRSYKDWKKSEDYKKWMAEWEKKKDSIERDTTSIYLTIPDSLSRTEENDIRELIEHFGEHNISADSFIKTDPFRIDLLKLKTSQRKVRFIYQSKLPGGGEFWKNDYGKYIAASISFTRIIFDKTKSYGVLNAGYVMAPLNGYGVRIFIKRNEDGKWVVDEVKGTWIS